MIELHDLTHQRKERMRRDEFVDLALASAGVPLIRIAVYQKYDPARIRGLILSKLCR